MQESEPIQEEYVVAANDIYHAHELYGQHGYADSIGEFYGSLERIVRCRYCDSFMRNEDEFNAFMDGRKSSLCMSHDPDGFCSWAEPRNEVLA